MTPRTAVPTGLTTYLLLLFAVPSALTVHALGGAGSPARVLGFLLMGWWAYDHIQRPQRGSNPVQSTYFLFLAAVLASYVAACTRALPANEASTASLGLVLVVSFGGSLLVASNGPRSVAAVTVILRRTVLIGSAVAVFACVQVLTHREWADRLHLPGLSANTPIYQLLSRDGLPRPNGTATHPIELGMVLTMLLPIAINLAIVDTHRPALRRYGPAGLIMAATFLSISRSAMIGAVVGLVMIAVHWAPQARRRALLAAPLIGFLVFVGAPGVLGSISHLFLGAGNDPSVQSRTDSYALAWDFIRRAPWLGRGLGTFLPTYRILDNQWLGLLIEVGVLGTICFAVLLLTALRSAESARLAWAGSGTDQVAQGVKASVAVGAVCLLFFDGFAFPIGSGLLFLMIGIAGALGRLAAAERRPLAHPVIPQLAPLPLPLRQLAPALLRRWYVTAVGLAVTAFLTLTVMRSPGVFWTQTDVYFLAPTSATYPNSITSSSGALVATAGLVAADVEGVSALPRTASPDAHLSGLGVRSGFMLRVPDDGGQWEHNFDRPVISIEAIGPSADGVAAQVDTFIARITSDLAERQHDDRVPVRDRITATLAPTGSQILAMDGRPSRAVAVTGALGLWGTTYAVALAELLVPRLRHRRTRRHPSATPAWETTR